MKLSSRLLLALALVPLGLAAQDTKSAAPAPESNRAVIISSFRIEPKPGQRAALKAALAAHAQKYHKGTQAWRVAEVLSGPDSGMLHIVEGPTTWTDFDGRGDLGPEHTKDYEANIAPLVARTTPDRFLSYQRSLSTVPATKWSNKVLIVTFEVKPGRSGDAQDFMKRWKAVNEKLGRNTVVWRTAWSGEIVYSMVYRLQNGFKELDEDGPSARTTMDQIYGAGEYDRQQRAAGEIFSRISSEMAEFKPELGSK